jgi:hypothetical protein
MKEIGRKWLYFNGQKCCIIEFYQFHILCIVLSECLFKALFVQLKEREN